MTVRVNPYPLIIVLTALALAAAPQAAAAEQRAERCFDAGAGKRKTSLGAHQWTVRQRVDWCASGSAITSIRRSTRVRTGTNWRLISRGGGVERHGESAATARSRFHFRLRYPYFEQNCYPRITISVRASGAFERRVGAGC